MMSEQERDTSLNLAQRISAIRSEVKKIAKTAKIQMGKGSYDAVNHDDVTSELRPLLVKYGVINTVSLVSCEDLPTGLISEKGRQYYQHKAIYDVVFINIDDTADRESIRSVGYADDTGDKGPGKACSYATKYALLKTFMVETGDNDEIRALESEAAGTEHIAYMNLVRELWPTISAVKGFLGDEPPKIDAAKEALEELTYEEKMQIWKAPTKGGVFTTLERKLLKEGAA